MFKSLLVRKEEGEEDYPHGREVTNLCHSCKWLSKDNPLTCEAFPGGIPLVILLGEFDHTAPFSVGEDDDEGLTYVEAEVAVVTPSI